MNDGTWLVQIFQMTDVGAQSSAAALLSSAHGVSVDARTCERGSFLIVECEPAAALSMYELVMMADQDAELIHSATGSTTATSAHS